MLYLRDMLFESGGYWAVNMDLLIGLNMFLFIDSITNELYVCINLQMAGLWAFSEKYQLT